MFVIAESYCISSLIGVVLNPFTAAFLIVISVFAAKFSTHICYAFQQALESEYENAETNRLTRTFQKVFIPEAMSTVAGSMMFLPLLFTNVAVFRYIAVLNLCCLIAGALHSLFLAPLTLAWCPKVLTGHKFLCTTSKNSDNVVMKSLN
ncbi:hypothetical protein COOONC_16390 [Cooperia oncophora]